MNSNLTYCEMCGQLLTDNDDICPHCNYDENEVD